MSGATGGSQNFGSSLVTYSPTFTGYASADFGDAEETRPSALILDPTGTGTTTPFSSLVTNVVARHMQEVKEKSVLPPPVTSTWKKKMKEFMNQKNEDLLGFLRKPLSQHPTLSQTEQFMRRFSRLDFSPTQANMTNVTLDSSGSSILPKLDEELQKVGPASVQQLNDEVKWLYENYRQAGEEVLRLDNLLKTKLDMFDKVYQKVVGFMELPMNEDTHELSVSVEKYVEKIFREHELEETYKALVEAFRRFAALKELVQFHRFVATMDKEPLCAICFAETVTHTLSPCGHTYCTTCVKRQMTQCSMCRSSIRERIRIYFG